MAEGPGEPAAFQAVMRAPAMGVREGSRMVPERETAAVCARSDEASNPVSAARARRKPGRETAWDKKDLLNQ